MSNYIITLETYLLDDEYNEDRLDKRLDIFKNITYPSVNCQSCTDYMWFIYVKEDNSNLRKKIKELDICENDHIKIELYNKNEQLPEVINRNNEGGTRGNWRRRNEITKKIIVKYEKDLGNKILVKMVLDDDDYIEPNYFNNIINVVKKNDIDDNDFILGIKDIKINYCNSKKIVHIYTKFFLHGAKCYVAKKNKYHCPYSILENLYNCDAKLYPRLVFDIVNGDTFHYMRYSKDINVSNINKTWIIDKVIETIEYNNMDQIIKHEHNLVNRF